MKPLLALAVLALLAGCGTTTVSLVVVRPAMINAHAYGGTVSIVGIAPYAPGSQFAAAQMQAELSQAVVNSVGQAVALVPQGGGLNVAGQVEEYGMHVMERERPSKCTDTITVTQDGVTTKQKVETPCIYKWFEWHARASVLMQVASAQGNVVFHQRLFAARDGQTFEQRGMPPPPPQPQPILDELRAQVVSKMAEVIVPHRVRVNATFYDCDKPAKAACEAGVKAMSRSDYDAAVRAFSDAQGMLMQAKASKEELAKTYWNRALVFEYSRRFDEAVTDYKQALALDPCDRYREGLSSVEIERHRHEQLVDQGLGH